MCRPMCNPATQAQEGRTNEQLKQLNKKGSIIQLVRGAKLEWVGHVWRTKNSIVKTREQYK